MERPMRLRCFPARRTGLHAAGTLMLALALAACSDPATDPAAGEPTPAPQDTTTTAAVPDPTGGSCLTAALGVCQDWKARGRSAKTS
jgi:hypothetical protein